VVVLLGLRLASAWWPTHKDARAWAEAVRARVPGPVYEVVFVEDMARYGLHLHLGADVEKIALAPLPSHRGYAEPTFDQGLESELAEREPDVVWIVKRERWDELQARAAALGYHARALGPDFHGRVIFRLLPADQPPAH
jgi:hypothetical protein